jgi:hypothetical protein
MSPQRIRDPACPYCIDLQVDSMFTTHDLTVFSELDELHIWNEAFRASRLEVRSAPMTAMLLRVWRFPDSVDLPQDESLWGCFSWGMLFS